MARKRTGQKPRNFPERKRQRQLRALERIKPKTRKGADNGPEIAALHEATAAGSWRHVRTKKDRTDFARFARA